MRKTVFKIVHFLDPIDEMFSVVPSRDSSERQSGI